MATIPVPPGINDPVFRKQLEFRKMLNRVSEKLSADNLKALKHLCYDFMPEARNDDMEAGIDIFDVFIKQNRMNYEDASFLCELMDAIQRKDLVAEINSYAEATKASVTAKPSASNMDVTFLRLVAGEVGREWKMLARYLGLDEITIESIHQAHFGDLHEASLQSLLKWKAGGPQANAKQLKRALQLMKLSSIVHKYFDAEINFNLSTMTVADETHTRARDYLDPSNHRPTMPELTDFPGKTRHFNIATEIGMQYYMVGTALLNDERGAIVSVIMSERRGNAEQISMDILSRWVQGKGIADHTWRGLLGVLRVHCPGLAQDIEETLRAENQKVHKKESAAIPETDPQQAKRRQLAEAGPSHTPPQHFPSELDVRETSALEEKPVIPLLDSRVTMLPNNPGILVDPVEVFVCDNKGGIYHNPTHGLTIQIPSGAIPAGMKLEISIGVLIHGNFEFPADVSPVSAIVWLCTENPDFVFLKQIKVFIPHFMECKNSVKARLQMKFMKASHFRSSADSFKFDPADGVPDFDTDTSKGIIYTRHLCLLCIVADISPEYLLSRRFCISCAHPYPSITAPAKILFFVTYFLKTCLKHMHTKLPKGYQITHQRSFHFQPQSDSISGDSECQCLETFVVPLQPSTIARERLDFWKLHHEEDLELMEDTNQYPPRMVLEIAELPSVMRVIKVTFKGTQETEEETMIAIKVPSKTTSSPSTPMHPQQQTPISMGDYEAKIPAAKRGCVVSTPTQITNIAKEMNTWKSVSHRLVSDAEAEEIRNNNPTDYLEQKKKALKIWSESLGHEATYVALMRIFYEDKNITMVEELIRQLNALEL